MNDPFFDEDGGEFADYPSPSASSPSVKPQRHNKETPIADPVAPGGRLSTRSPAASSSVASRSFARDRTGSTTSNATDVGKPGKHRKKHGKLRRKASQELFDVQWESDVKVSKCGLCRSDFSLVRRKHHCRNCGRVMCSDCSSFLYFEFSHRKHRVCTTCNNELLAEQEAFDRETLAGGSQGQDTTTNLFEDSSDDGPSAVAVTPASSGDVQQNNLRSTLANARNNGDDEKARKKKEKREKLEKRAERPLVGNTERISRRQVEEKKNEAALFDEAEDDWFTDVPGQNARSHDTGVEFSEAGSKGEDRRDRVRDTYTISSATDQKPILPPMAGSTLTAGITGKGYFSDQFRYDDVGGPALGHDDDLSVEMPRPKQQPPTRIYTDHSVKPSHLTVNGYFSEQFQYDNVSGPSLGHDDDHSVGMPRPKQQPVDMPYSYDSVNSRQRLSEHNTPPDDNGSSEFQPRLTFKDGLKDIFGSKQRDSKKENKSKARKPRARGNENMTLDELNPSYSSEDEPRLLASAMLGTTATSAQPMFYENDADKFVVDDSPGFFEATIAEQEAQHKRKEEQQQQLASDTAWVNSSALPPSVPAHRFSSEQDSYSIVDHPSHTSNSPVENQRVRSARASTTGSNGNTKGGFTGALKRFFGMGSKTVKATTPPKSVKVSAALSATPPPKGSTEKLTADVPVSTHRGNSILNEPASSGLARPVVHVYETSREEPAPQESFRNTMGAYADPTDGHSRFEASVPLQASAISQSFDQIQQRSDRKRRDTFDDLFESPKNDLAASGVGRNSLAGANGWTTGRDESSHTGRGSYSASAVGVARFDHRRSIDETDDFTLGDEPKRSQPPAPLSNNSTDAWRQSATMSILDDRKYATQSEESTFTWSNVRAVPGLGTATYAVPTSLQPRGTYDDNRDSSFQYDTPSVPLGSIMDDLKRGSTAKTSPAKPSIDDFFAEFEEPNDYVFDPETGGYVATRAPPRAAAARPVSRSLSTELQSPRALDQAVAKSSEREYYAPSETLAGATAITTVLSKGEDVGGEVADIIVDKISSLEGELAALKLLIRNRKGSGGNSSLGYKPRAIHISARASIRKESIFDNDSSDEDRAKPSDPYASSIQPAPKREGKRRPGSKKKPKKRKDSFADLFEDSPNEKETFGGATSYEALFQAGPKTTGASKEDSDDEEPTPKPNKTRAARSRRRSSRKKIDQMATKDDSGSEPEFGSLKGRRGKQSFRRKTNDGSSDMVVDFPRKSENQLVSPPVVDIVPVAKPMKRKSEEEDHIDALFDSSDDRDVAKLYGGDDSRESEDKNLVLESHTDQLPKDKSVPFTHPSSTSLTPLRDEEVSGNSFTVVTSTQPVEHVGTHSNYLDSQILDDADEDEDFSINWTKMKKTKSRRHKSRRNPSPVTKSTDESVTLDDSIEDLLLDPSLLSVDHGEAHLADIHGDQGADPSTASSNWMPVSALGGETIDLSRTGGEDLKYVLQPVPETKSVEPTVESELPGGTKHDDDQDTTSAPVMIDYHEPIEELSASARALSERDDTSDDDQVLPKRNMMKVHSDSAKADSPKKSDAAFDIFDRASGVDFLSATLPVGLTTFSHADERADGEDENEESLSADEEAFSFEIKASKKRASRLDVAAESKEPSTSLPTSSVDDNIEIGKYSTSSVASSRTPSVDGSIEDLEEALLDGESVFGKEEAQAFDSDWNQMQAKEKERKKRLQAKQRQAQRDKVLRKQGASSRSLTGSSAATGLTKSKSKSGKKKKDKDDTASSSSHHKKSGSSRKHRHREKGDGDSAAPSEPPRSLTEL